MTNEELAELERRIGQEFDKAREGRMDEQNIQWVSRCGINHDWVATRLECADAGSILRKFFTPVDWGDPVAAVIWEHENWISEFDCEATTKIIAGLFANGRVFDVRFNKAGWRASSYPSMAPSP